MTTVEFYLNEVWSKTLKGISESKQIKEDQFDLYFSGSKLISIDDDCAKVLASNFINYTLMSQYKQLIEFCLEIVLGTHKEVKIIQTSDIQQPVIPTEIANNKFIKTDIDPNFTFANFVVGRSNVQAQVAALTCSTNLGMVYNPLFIYGNSGVGKTHLLLAIANQVRNSFPHKQIGFISGLDFVEGVYQSIKNRTIDEFKESFHNLDLLLVDDIQFIAGKEKTHEIFFSVFNDLVNNRKQVCITADRTPSDIKGLEDRIISRFNQGLNVNIETPEYETSLNILKMKVSNSTIINQTIDDEVLSYIATNFSQDVRQLEGALNRLLFYAINFSPDNPITLKVAIEAFKEQISENKNELSINKIKKTVCDYYGLSKQQLNSKSRTKNIANARHIAMFLCRKLLDAPYKEIGQEFGKRDHSTVINACERVESNIKSSPIYLKVINEIESKLK